MAIVNKVEHIGVPPQLRSTLIGLNSVLTDLGFPRWILVKWQVPPLLTFWLLLTLLLSGLRWFALSQIAFTLYKLYEEYGEPVSDWVNGANGYRIQRHRSASQNGSTRSSSKQRTESTPKTTSPTYEDEEGEYSS
ncbi:uncharacterized protein [Watersipora subatra]|uniref:uncharacterized protein n=1 Tax=Watersipora subatra TaxID=2589382 RepID=UPI00355C545D